MNKHEYLQKLDQLELDKKRYCIISGGAMVMLGLKEKTNDIDIRVKPDYFEELKDIYQFKKSDKYDNLYELSDEIEVAVCDFESKDIDYIDGYPVNSIENELAWKIQHNREKDKQDIENIKKYLNNKGVVMNKIIAIDGPAGSGKGTLAKALAKKMNLVNIDTGATYRCVALKVLRNNVKIEEKEKIIEIAKNINIDLLTDGKVLMDGEDVTKEIRNKEVTSIVSPISSIVEVRNIMVSIQRKIAKGKDVVMEGRDITTVVFPDTKYKFYLDASIESRADRRYKENMEKGINMTYQEVYESIKARDYNDMHKEVGSLIRTDDQIYIDTTNLTVEEEVEIIEKVVNGDK